MRLTKLQLLQYALEGAYTILDGNMREGGKEELEAHIEEIQRRIRRVERALTERIAEESHENLL